MPKSSKQRALELKARRGLREKKLEQRLREDRRAYVLEIGLATGAVPVNAALLDPSTSYSASQFMERGYYLDQEFICKDCNKQEVWTATQQKWWYEIAKGNVSTVANRCRPCRRRERERAAAHKRASDEGRQRKARAKAGT